MKPGMLLCEDIKHIVLETAQNASLRVGQENVAGVKLLPMFEYFFNDVLVLAISGQEVSTMLYCLCQSY